MKKLFLQLILLMFCQNIFAYSIINFTIDDGLLGNSYNNIENKVNELNLKFNENYIETEEVVTSINCPDTIFVDCYEELAANPPYSFYADCLMAGGSAISNCGIIPVRKFLKNRILKC